MKKFRGSGKFHSISLLVTEKMDGGGKVTFYGVISAIAATYYGFVYPRKTSTMNGDLPLIFTEETDSIKRLISVDLKLTLTHSKNFQGDINASV